MKHDGYRQRPWVVLISALLLSISLAPSSRAQYGYPGSGSGTHNVSGYVASASSATPFVPTQIAGLVLWLRADKGITIGTGVHIWADQSGTADSNKNVSQATGSAQPTVNSADSSYNGQATLSFASASSQYLQSGTWAASLSQPATWIVVGNTSATGTLTFTDGIAASHENLIQQLSNQTELDMYAGSNIAYPSAANLGTPCVMAGVFNSVSGTSYLYQNNSQTAIDSGNAGVQPLTGLTVGARYNAGTPLGGKIAEIIGYSAALTSTQLKQVFQYLGSRYGIQVSLLDLHEPANDNGEERHAPPAAKAA